MALFSKLSQSTKMDNLKGSFRSKKGESITFGPKCPIKPLFGKTIVITGAENEIGKAAAKHFVRLHAARLVLAVGSSEMIEHVSREVSQPNMITEIETWVVDYSRSASIIAFAEKFLYLDRVDSVILNHEIAPREFSLIEGNESTLAVNVVNTTLLSLMLLRILRLSAAKWDIAPNLTLVCAEGEPIDFSESTTDNIFDALNNANTTDMRERYHLCKALRLVVARKLGEMSRIGRHFTDSFVTVNVVNPGFSPLDMTFGQTSMAVVSANGRFWTFEDASRMLVHSTYFGTRSHSAIITFKRKFRWGNTGISNNWPHWLGRIKVTLKDLEPTPIEEAFWTELSSRLEVYISGITQTIIPISLTLTEN